MHGNKRKTTHVKMVSDLSVMNPSELWTMLVDDRSRDVLLSVSSSKGKGKGKGTGQTQMFDSQEFAQPSQLTIVSGAS